MKKAKKTPKPKAEELAAAKAKATRVAMPPPPAPRSPREPREVLVSSGIHPQPGPTSRDQYHMQFNQWSQQQDNANRTPPQYHHRRDIYDGFLDRGTGFEIGTC